MRLLKLARPYWRGLGGTVAIGAALGLVALITPLLTKMFVDGVFPSKDVSLLAVLVTGVTLTALVSALLSALRSFYSQAVHGALGNAVVLCFYNHVQHLPTEFFETHRTGEVQSRFGDARTSLASLSRILDAFLLGGVFIVAVPPILLLVHWKLALLSFLSSPLGAVVSVASGATLRKVWQQSIERQAEVSAIQIDALHHARTIKLAAAERSMFFKMQDALSDAFASQLRANRASTVATFARGVLRTAGTAACTWYGWKLIIRGEISLGAYLAFSAYLALLTGPITELTSLFADFQKTSVSLARMFEYLDLPTEQDAATVYQPVRPLTRRIRGAYVLENVEYGYSTDRPVLRDFTITIPSGSLTAVVGTSGVGKSTLIRLLAALDEPTAGSILLDGHQLGTYPLSDLRRQTAVVWQESGIVRGTVRANLLLGVDAASDEELDRVLHICRLSEMIGRLPLGLDTMIAEGGSTLSGGQRQRVALARAVLRSTPILLLDEATANMDTAMERAIIKDLRTAVPGQTIILVTHRLSTALMADQVCCISDDHLVECGPHEEVMKTSAAYRAMHDATIPASHSSVERSRQLVAAHSLGLSVAR